MAVEPSLDELLAELGRSNREPVSDQELDEDIDHRRGRQDLRFRPWMFWSVVGLMIGEVALMFMLVFCQGVGGFFNAPFDLDRWVLTSVGGGVLLQTFGLAKIIARALLKEGNA